MIDVRHPLDPLSADEIMGAAEIVRAAHDLGPGMRFETITLAEPPLRNGPYGTGSADRRAFLAVYDTRDGSVHGATVSLSQRQVLDWRLRPGARPRIAAEEFLLAERAVKSDARFLAALARRGIANPDRVRIDPWSAGVFGHPEETDRRVVQGFAFLRDTPFDNQYAHPIEGLTAVVDINNSAVLNVEDTDRVPVPVAPANYAARFQTQWRTDLKPIEIVQPQGPSFTVRGNEVIWCGWRLRIGFTPREGLVLHDVATRDKGRWRDVLKRACLAEMVVPYGSPRGRHPRKNAFDCGEYGVGMLANSLALGCECLGVIRFGHHRLPRTEDFPVQPAMGCGFVLQPFGFFDRNPALDVPPASGADCCT